MVVARESESWDPVSTFIKVSIMKILGEWMLDKSDASILRGNRVAIDSYGLNDARHLDATIESLRRDLELGLSLLRDRWLSVEPIVEEVLRKADDIIRFFPNIERDGPVLKIHGSVGMYEVDIIDGTVVLCCPGGHMKFRSPCISLRSDKVAGIDPLPEPKSERALIVALNLACDDHILSSLPFLRILAKCPKCLAEGKIRREIADLVEEPASDDYHRVMAYLPRLSEHAWGHFAFLREKLFEDIRTRVYTARSRQLKYSHLHPKLRGFTNNGQTGG